MLKALLLPYLLPYLHRNMTNIAYMTGVLDLGLLGGGAVDYCTALCIFQATRNAGLLLKNQFNLLAASPIPRE